MRWRLIAAFVGVTIVILAAQDIPLGRYLRRVETERAVASIERDAFILAGSSEGVLSGEAAQDPNALQVTADVYAARTKANVVVTDASGVAVAVSGDEARLGEDYSTRPEIATALTGSPTSGRRPSETLGEDIVYVAVPVLSGALPVGVVRLTYPASTIDDRVSVKVRGILAVGLISLATAALAAALMAATIVRPIRRLQRATESVAAGDFESRAVIDEGAPEIRGLASSFNTMTEKISTLVERQRSFAGDASHQLRTPLTALRLQLERAAVNIDADPVAARRDIEAASEETERLQRLVEGLLMLARAGQDAVATETIDVADIVTERAAIWAPLADERGVTLSASAIASLSARAVPGVLEQIVDNYIDNALNASGPGNEIMVSAVAADGWATVHVTDRGPGMPTDQLQHAFDRFWRASNAGHEGSGLGLAIVRQLAEASGGDVALANRAGGGLDASVRLPRA
ncbi:MAG: HAMP domain-containing protein [Ilumatobacteraceae bacterium]|nr:HAMP domain-containing protein [Ilumatobacteraceae bacterium]